MHAKRIVGLVAVIACSGAREKETVTPRTPDSAVTVAALAKTVDRRFPIVGVAVLSDSLIWCAEFPRDSTGPQLTVGTPVAIVFAELEEVPAFPAKIAAIRDRECQAPFGQPRWFDYSAYDLEPLDSLGYPDSEETPLATLVVASNATWIRGTDSLVRADLDGDGLVEEARRCYADEGEHFSIWTRMPDNTYRLRAHEYYDLGAFVEVTCSGIEAAGIDSARPR